MEPNLPRGIRSRRSNPPTSQFSSPPSTFPVPNVPGQDQQRVFYSPNTSPRLAPHGGTNHPSHGMHDEPYTHIAEQSVPQVEIGYDAFQEQTRGRNPTGRPDYIPLYSLLSPNPPNTSTGNLNFAYHRNSEVIISRFQGYAGGLNTSGRSYYLQGTDRTVFSSTSAPSMPEFPAAGSSILQPRFDWTGEQRHWPPQMPVPRPFSRCTGKKRGLVIGINYGTHPDARFRLKYGVEDAFSVANFLRENLGFARNDIRIMTDKNPWDYPTKENIMSAMSALVHDAQPHDSLFCYFSGHAVQIEDPIGDEPDGFAECICAIDYRGGYDHKSPGLIVDDTMHDLMVKRLPRQCRLTVVFDSCHSGTLLDLPYIYDSRGIVKEFRHPDRLAVLRQKSSYADVVSLSASKDHQEAWETSHGGALRHAFIDCMKKYQNNVTYKQLIVEVREYMRINGYPQKPQLSSSHEINTDLRFII